MEKEIVYWDRLRKTIVTESGYRYEDQKSEPVSKKTLIGETLDNIYEQFYKLNNSLRYCNGSYYVFTNKSDQDDYLEWNKGLSKSRSFNLFYGNGVVD